MNKEFLAKLKNKKEAYGRGSRDRPVRNIDPLSEHVDMQLENIKPKWN